MDALMPMATEVQKSMCRTERQGASGRRLRGLMRELGRRASVPNRVRRSGRPSGSVGTVCARSQGFASQKVLSLSIAELRRIHKTSHGSSTRMMKFLLSSLTEDERRRWTAEVRELSDRVTEVVKGCGSCAAFQARTAAPVSQMPRTDLGYLDRGWADVFVVDSHRKLFAALFIDDATADISVELLCGPATGKTMCEAYLLGWALHRGHFRELVTDGGGENVAKEFVSSLEELGVFKSLTAGKISEAHGKVERPVRTVRWSLDRLIDSNDTSQWTEAQWRICLKTIENAVRNEVLLGESSASLRATGRCSSVHRNLLTDTAVTGGAACSPSQLQTVQDAALESYRVTLCSRRLREMLSSQHQPMLVEYQAGERVEFMREETRGRSGEEFVGGDGTGQRRT